MLYGYPGDLSLERYKMASQYVIDLGYNDDLQTVIKKVNHNFKAVMGQQSKQAQIDAGDAAEVVADIVGDAVEDLVGQIENEANARTHADEDLEDAIETLQQSLAAVAFSGDYNDLINTPDPVNVQQDPNTNILNIS